MLEQELAAAHFVCLQGRHAIGKAQTHLEETNVAAHLRTKQVLLQVLHLIPPTLRLTPANSQTHTLKRAAKTSRQRCADVAIRCLRRVYEPSKTCSRPLCRCHACVLA